jgi:Family of unknown function (DUF5906)
MNIIYPFCNGVSNNFAAGNELNDSITLSDLAEEKVWVAWKEQPNKQGKLTKIPKDPATGDNAKVPSDPTTYGTLGDAIKCCETMKGKGGVGVVLGAIGNGRHLVGIDLDSCREPKSETITDWAAEVIERFDTYSEISPSQTGIKLFFRLSTVDLQTLHVLLGRNHKGEQLARKTFAVGAHREVAIDTARFYAVTGARLQDSPESLRTVSLSDVSWFIEEAGPNYLARHHKANGQQQTNRRDMSGSGHAFRFLRERHLQGMSEAEAMAALLTDSTEAGEWAQRSDQRQHKRAWDNSNPFSKPEINEVMTPNEGVSLNDFRAYMPTHSYIYMPTRDMWPASSVNSRVARVPMFNADGTPKLDKKGQQEFMSPARYLDDQRPVEQMTWAPGLPMLIPDRIISEGGWIERRGVTVFNLYRPPIIQHGDPRKAGPWLRLVIKVFGKTNARHIIYWCAHRVQLPEMKINHALVLGSNEQGIGKDTILEPVKRAVGPWNCSEVSPKSVTARFNGFLKSVILRISEARDLGDISRYDFYEAMKAYIAAPPDVLRVDEKNLREHSILNCVGIIYTTNHKQGGMFLPAEDRRHFVAWSDCKKTDFKAGYWDEFWRWLDNGGDGHVAAYLATLDISKFNPKAPPPKTEAFWEIVDSNRAPEESELTDVLEQMNYPPAVTIDMIAVAAGTRVQNIDFAEWLRDRKNNRILPHRLEKCGYVAVRNDTESSGRWKIGGKRQTVYARFELSNVERYNAIKELQKAEAEPARSMRVRTFI